ncbi:MAG: CvpA family protein [Maricaulaceae bacterium]|jgi:membrane protein required for colicin V production
MALTFFDFGVIGVVLLSTIVAFARGFVRELLSVAAFIAAAIAALWAPPTVVPAVEQAIQPYWLAFAVVVVGVFLAVFVGVTMISHSLTSMLYRGDRVGFFDRVLGIAFGGARGLLLAALFVLFFNVAVTPSPSWMTDAQSYPLVFKAAHAIQTLAPESARIAASPLAEG